MKLWLIKLPYWLGIAADALWAIALFFPVVFGALTGVDGFSPDWQLQSVMAIGGVLMAGWTVLLIWAVQRPVERRFVILLTAWFFSGQCSPVIHWLANRTARLSISDR